MKTDQNPQTMIILRTIRRTPTTCAMSFVWPRSRQLLAGIVTTLGSVLNIWGLNVPGHKSFQTTRAKISLSALSCWTRKRLPMERKAVRTIMTQHLLRVLSREKLEIAPRNVRILIFWKTLLKLNRNASSSDLLNLSGSRNSSSNLLIWCLFSMVRVYRLLSGSV
jgi:hypothetical protein